MIESTAELLRSKGLAATSFTDITERSSVPRGVIYHHFPNGKAELVRAAVEWTGRTVVGHLESLPSTSPAGVIEAFLDSIRYVLTDSAHGASCAVAAVTVETSVADGGSQSDTSLVFEAWMRALQRKFIDVGVANQPAEDLATMLLVILQGSHILTRASGNLDAFERVSRLIRATMIASPPGQCLLQT